MSINYTGNCIDGLDEDPWKNIRECPYHRLIECEDRQVLCKIDGGCISKYSVCDGVKDCADAADELC